MEQGGDFLSIAIAFGIGVVLQPLINIVTSFMIAHPAWWSPNSMAIKSMRWGSVVGASFLICQAMGQDLSVDKVLALAAVGMFALEGTNETAKIVAPSMAIPTPETK